MNRTIKGAIVGRFHDDCHDRLRTHRAGFMAACNFVRRLQILRGLGPCEEICKSGTSEPDRAITSQMPGLNNEPGLSERLNGLR